MALRTTVVGSWWPPTDELEHELRRHHAGELSESDSIAILNRCATQAIQEQINLGLDEWTGGEYFTDNFIDHMQRVVTGIEIDKPDEDDVFDYDDLAHARIVGELSAPDGLGYATAYRRESALPGGVRKATVVGPLEVAIHAQDQQQELRRQLPALIKIVNAELRALADAGCPHVQLDAPMYGSLVNSGQMETAEAADQITQLLDGVKATRGLHICNGNLRGRPISPVLRNAAWVEILERLEDVVDVACLECSYFHEYLERDAFSRLPIGMELAAGIVDEASYWVESVKKIRDRAADWARVVGEERLWLSPSCGFGRHPARSREVLHAKLEHMVEAAATL